MIALADASVQFIPETIESAYRTGCGPIGNDPEAINFVFQNLYSPSAGVPMRQYK